MFELETLKGRTAIVTGAGQGIGRIVARTLAGMDARVVVNDLSESTAECTARELRSFGAESIAFGADVTDAPAVQAMVDWAAHAFEGVHILVNNAGVLYPTKVVDISEEEWERVIDVNLKGTFLCSQAAVSYTHLTLPTKRIV